MNEVTSDQESDDVADVGAASVQLRAVVSSEWSWPSSAARIPQIYDLTVDASASIPDCRITITLADADLEFGKQLAHSGPLPAGRTVIDRVHVPLSARRMSQVTDRQPATCAITLEEVGTGRLLASFEESVDMQPRDLWLRAGDPFLVPAQRRAAELSRMLRLADPESPEATTLAQELDALTRAVGLSSRLSGALMASFVRPNHPEVATIAREAADILARNTGDASFDAYQRAAAGAGADRADDTVSAIFRALQSRNIVYSEPPPGWDYTHVGQRIRDHGDVARAGEGTCLDTTVLMAAVMEQVGILPVLVMIKGHILVGYWRQEPAPGKAGQPPQWYPGQPFVTDKSVAANLLADGFLGVIETTAVTASNNATPHEARTSAVEALVKARNDEDDWLELIDVVAARRAGVSPLPAVTERPDGVVEVVEYRPGGRAEVPKEEVESARRRQVDEHPARYRTWKSSLFTLNANNALLNLGSSARVQPLVVPADGLGASRTCSIRTTHSNCTVALTFLMCGRRGDSRTPPNSYTRSPLTTAGNSTTASSTSRCTYSDSDAPKGNSPDRRHGMHPRAQVHGARSEGGPRRTRHESPLPVHRASAVELSEQWHREDSRSPSHPGSGQPLRRPPQPHHHDAGFRRADRGDSALIESLRRNAASSSEPSTSRPWIVRASTSMECSRR